MGSLELFVVYQQYTDNEADTDTSLKIYTKEGRVYGCEETIVNITKAKISDVQNIMTFYDSLITTMSQDPYRPKWIRGVYPSLDDIKRYCGNEECYLAVREEKIIGSVMIVHDSDENHTQIAWNVSAPKNEITTLHLLAVDPKLQGRSIGFKLMKFAENLCRDRGDKVIRLDALPENVPGNKLYRKCGYHLVSKETRFYESAGYIDFNLYELAL